MKWISIKDRVPDDKDKLCLIFLPEDKSIHSAYYSKFLGFDWSDRESSCCCAGVWSSSDVSHWIYVDDIPKPD